MIAPTDTGEAEMHALDARREILTALVVLKGHDCPEALELAQLNAAQDASRAGGEQLQ